MSHGRQVMTIMLCTTELAPRNEPWKAGYDNYAVYYRTITQKWAMEGRLWQLCCVLQNYHPEMSHGRQVMTITLCTTELSPRNEPWKAGYDNYAVYYRTITQKWAMEGRLWQLCCVLQNYHPEMSHGRQVMTITLCTIELSPRNEPWKAVYDNYAVYYRTITQKWAMEGRLWQLCCVLQNFHPEISHGRQVMTIMLCTT